MPKAISKQEIIDDVKRVFKETDDTTRENYLAHGKYSRAPITRIFGGWNELLKHLGCEINMYKSICEKDVLDDVNRIRNEFDSLTAEVYRKHGMYSQPVIDRLFGSFSNLKRILGCRIDGRFTSNEMIKENVLSLYKEYGFLSQSIIRSHCIVSVPTIINRFGSFQNLCDELGVPLFTEEDLSKFARFVFHVLQGVIKETPLFEYTFDWLVNPSTNTNLRLDLYYPSLKLAVEIDGDQHYSPVSFYHNNGRSFEYQQHLDRLKEDLLKSHGISLIRFTCSDKASDIVDKIKLYTTKCG